MLPTRRRLIAASLALAALPFGKVRAADVCKGAATNILGPAYRKGAPFRTSPWLPSSVQTTELGDFEAFASIHATTPSSIISPDDRATSHSRFHASCPAFSTYSSSEDAWGPR